MCFIEVPDFRVGIEGFQEFGTAMSQDDVLGDAAGRVVIVEPLGDLTIFR